jgi:hypothetical protein
MLNNCLQSTKLDKDHAAQITLEEVYSVSSVDPSQPNTSSIRYAADYEVIAMPPVKTERVYIGNSTRICAL